MSNILEYKTKLVTPQGAVNVVRSGDWVDYGQFAVQVIELDKAPVLSWGCSLYPLLR
jgi:hypothetical protein